MHGIRLIMKIYRAYAADDKEAHIDDLLESLRVLELQLQLAHDLKLINTPALATAADLADDIGRQAGGWRKSAIGKLRAPQLDAQSRR